MAYRPAFSQISERSRRVKRLVMCNGFLPLMWGAGEHRYRMVEGALPADAEIVAVQHEWRTTTFYLRSDEFPVVDGEQVPELILMFENLEAPHV